MFLYLIIFIFIILELIFKIDFKILLKLPYKALISLSVFMIISNGIYYSNYPKKILYFLFKNIEKFSIFKFLIIYSGFIFLLAFFLTNDIALFVALPFVKYLNFQKDILKNLGFSFIWSANIGACASPIGSPQNIFIWSYLNVGFFKFCLYLFPLFLSMLLSFLIFLFSFQKNFSKYHKIDVSRYKNIYLNLKLFKLSSFLLFLNIVSFETNFFYLTSLFTFIIYLTLYPNLIKKFDYKFILLFIFLSLDINIIQKIPGIKNLILKFKNPYFESAFLSQIISNFPSCILITNITHKPLESLYGANVACNGMLHASIANLIGINILRLNKKEFMKKSMIAFFLSLLFGYLALKVLKIFY